MLMLILPLLLALLSPGWVLGIPVVADDDGAAWPNTIWGPTARIYHWRCRSPKLVEVTEDLMHWSPSSICLEGTCCSPLAAGPLCSKDACRLSRESGTTQGQVAFQ